MSKSVIGKLSCLTIAIAACLLLFPSIAGAQEKTLTLKMQSVPIKKVMEEIERQTNSLFVYTDDVNVEKLVSIDVTNQTLKMVFAELFEKNGIVWKTSGTNTVLSNKKDETRVDKAIFGVIKDVRGDLVVGAAVLVKGTSTGVSTDLDGKFSFGANSVSPKAVLEVVCLGYKTVSVPVNNRNYIEIILEDDAIVMEGTIVTALGIKKSEKAVTYNVQTLDSDVFRNREANLVNSLQGKLAGVQINASAAGVGGETKVVMRGAKSISSDNNALYVLDGIPLPALSMTSPGDSYSVYSGSALSGDGISNLNPDDFSNTSALVGPSAAALYGYRAANGVLMLTTRTGEGKGTELSYSTNTTFSTPLLLPNLQNSYGAKEGMYSSWGNKMASDRNWSPFEFFQTGYNTQHSLSLSVGGKNSHTYVSASFTDARGLIPNNDYTRYNVTANHKVTFLKDKMHLSLLAMYINVKEQNMTSGGQYYNPLIPLYLMSPSDHISKYSVYERYDAGRNFPVQYWSWGSLNLQAQNPFWIVNRNMFNNSKNRFLLGASLSYDITDWLDASARVRTDNNNTLAEQKNYASTSGLFAGDKGRYMYGQHTTNQTYADILLNVHKNFSDNLIQLNASVGASVETYYYTASNIAGDLLGVPNLFTFSNMNTNKGFAKTTYNDQTQALFATAQLGFRNFVFLDATVRSDWSSALIGTDALPVVYPSVGLSAILTDMFKSKSRWLSYAKLRGSYAEVGNPVMRFITVPTRAVTNGQPSKNTYGTADNFQPERTRSWEVGADIRLWMDKIIFSGTYYHSMTYNQVFTPEMPSSFKYSTYYVNSGRVDNRGVELSLQLNQNIGSVDWSSTLIYSRNINKIVDMLDVTIDGVPFVSDQLSVGGTSGVQMWLKKGGSIGDLYVRGLKTDEHGFIWVSPTSSTVVPAPIEGGLESLIYAGNTNPSWTGSWRNDFSWKGLNFSFMFNARIGGVGVSLTEATLDSFGMSARTAEARNNGGALVNGVRIPAQSYFETIGANGMDALGAYYTYSMTNIRLGEVSIGYDIPVDKWQKVIKNLNLSVVGKNLAMIYCKAPFDPEVVSGAGNYSAGIDYFMMPSTRNIGFSAKITF